MLEKINRIQMHHSSPLIAIDGLERVKQSLLAANEELLPATIRPRVKHSSAATERTEWAKQSPQVTSGIERVKISPPLPATERTEWVKQSPPVAKGTERVKHSPPITHALHKTQLADLFRELLPLTSDWQNIGTLLHLLQDALKVIRADNPNRTRDCLREIMGEWLEVVAPPLHGSSWWT